MKRSLKDKVVWITGAGSGIGQNAAITLSNLGMKVIGYDPALSVEAAWKLSSQVERINNLPDLFAGADIVTLHIPASKETFNAPLRGIIDSLYSLD
mgnify:CR=1 FL=1